MLRNGKIILAIIENILTPDEVHQFREKLTRANWIDGARTAGSRSIAVKQDLQLDRDDPLAVELGNVILRNLGHNPLFVSAALAEKIWPPVFNCYQYGGHYGTHSDAALMRRPEANLTIRSDLSATIFLGHRRAVRRTGGKARGWRHGALSFLQPCTR